MVTASSYLMLVHKPSPHSVILLAATVARKMALMPISRKKPSNKTAHPMSKGFPHPFRAGGGEEEVRGGTDCGGATGEGGRDGVGSGGGGGIAAGGSGGGALPAMRRVPSSLQNGGASSGKDRLQVGHYFIGYPGDATSK